MSARIVFLRLPPYFGLRRHHPQNVMAPVESGTALTVLDRMGHDVTLVDGWARWLVPETLAADVSRLRPDVFVIETTTTTAEAARDLAVTVAGMTGCVAVACGQHATTMPDTLLRDGGFAVCVLGELELTLPELVSELESKRDLAMVKGIRWRDGDVICSTEPRPLVADLDRLPFFDYGLLGRHRYFMSSCTVSRWRPIRWGFILSSRGCPFDCIYCSPTLRQSYGRRYRAHSPEYVVENIEYLVRAHGVTAVMIPDDVFSLDRERTLRICSLLRRKRLGVPWFCQTRADCLDRELIGEMKASGCGGACLGVESGSDRVLAYLQKDTTSDQIRSTVKAISAAGMNPTLFFMVGNPTETLAEYEETLALAIELEPLIIQVAYFTPYPGSIFYERMTRDGIARPEDGEFERYSHYNDCQFNYTAMDDQTYRKLQLNFYRRFYLRPRYFGHYARGRLPYALSSARHEWGLAREAWSFIRQRR